MMDEIIIRKVYRQSVIIAYAFFSALAAYVVIVEFIFNDIRVPESYSTIYTHLRTALMILTVAEIFLVFFVRNLILTGKTRMLFRKLGEYSPESKEIEMLRRLSTTSTITFAVWDSIAIYGLILYLLGQNKTDFYLLLGVAFCLMVFHFPKFSDWESRLRNLDQNNIVE